MYYVGTCNNGPESPLSLTDTYPILNSAVKNSRLYYMFSNSYNGIDIKL